MTNVYLADYNLYDDGDGLDNGTPHAPDIWDAFKEGSKDRAISTTQYDSLPPRDGNPKIVASNLPKHFSLSQNYPNPFNPTTVIRFQLRHATEVKVVIYNTLGQVVRTLVDEQRARGAYQVQWDGKDVDELDVASGLYFVRMKAGDFIGVRKMVLLR